MGLEEMRKVEEIKSPDRRKAKKPLIEKQRRKRINESLNELKVLVLHALNKDASLYSKMEKADILDLTVNYLKSVKCDQGFLRDATSLAKYRLGYNDCAGEMTQYIMSDAGLDYHNRAKLLSQMASSCQKANLRTTAEMNLPGSRAPLYARPPAIPIALSANRLPPSMSSPIPIYPSSFNPTEINRPVNVSMGSSSVILKESNVKSNCYSPLFMTSSTALSGLESSGSNVWRPW